MRSLGLSLSGLACVVALIVIAPKPANSQPSVLPLVSSASGVEEVGYYYRRYGSAIVAHTMGTDTAIVARTMGTDTAIVVHTMGTDTAIVVRTMGTDTADGGKPTPVRTITIRLGATVRSCNPTVLAPLQPLPRLTTVGGSAFAARWNLGNRGRASMRDDCL
jgi:hypothetical protein